MRDLSQYKMLNFLSIVEMDLEQADIHDLPTEILVMIFEYLNLHELVSTTSQTCMRWRGTISSFVVRPKLLNLAKTNLMFKRDI